MLIEYTKLNCLKSTDEVLYVSSNRSKKGDIEKLKKAGGWEKLGFKAGWWEVDQDIREYANVKHAKKIVNFLKSSKNTLIYAEQIEVGIVLEACRGVIQENKLERYSVGDAVKGKRKVIPDVWLAALLDNEAKMGGRLVGEIESYLATRIAIDSAATIIEGEFD